MESFVHLRKGRTPKRLHADLDGLKDDELGRGGFTGRTANIYRRNDPTAYRAVGPLRPIDVLSDQLKHSDDADAAGGPLLMFSNADCQVLLSRRSEPMPFFVRDVDGDLLSFVHKGTGLLETEFGPLRYRQGDWVYIPKACTFRHVPEEESTLLMIQATDEFRVSPPGYMGRHFPFDPSQATIPGPAPIDDDRRDEYEVQLIDPSVAGGPTSLFYRHHPLDVEGWRGDNFGCPRRVRRGGGTGGARELPAQAEDQTVRYRAGVHAPDRRRRVPAHDQCPGPCRPSRHLLQQPVPRHRLRPVDGEGGRGPRRVHQGRQEPARLLQGRAGRMERRRLAFGVLPTAGTTPHRHRKPVRRRAGPDEARPDPGRRHHAAGRPHQQARHVD
jgi:hypothetical protein